MRLLRFCETFLRLRNQPISFSDRGYLHDVYAATDRNLILRCSRQVEKSTMLGNRIICEAIANPGISMIFVCPRWEQAKMFMRSRLIPMIEGSPIVRRHLLGRHSRPPQISNLFFANGSMLFVRAAYHSADPVRGLSGDLLFVDEFQDIAHNTLPVLQETLSHSSNPRVILTATPKGEDNHVEAVFRQSTGCEWHIPCRVCGHTAIPDAKIIGIQGTICPQCGGPLFPADGAWVARHPTATWGNGFWMNHLMVPWLNFAEILGRRDSYAAPQFLNECLGLPTSLGDHVITRAEIEACCTPQPMAANLKDLPRDGKRIMLAGIDWGAGGAAATVVTLGYIRRDKTFVVVRFEQLRGQEDPNQVLEAVAKLCRDFQVRYIGADGRGNGSTYNRLLLDRLGWATPLFAVIYSGVDQEPRQDGALWSWTVDRTGSIGGLFSRIKKRLTHFPRLQDCGSFLDQFTCVVAGYDEYHRAIKYICPDGQHDDALHSLNYAQLVALRLWHTQYQCN